MSFDKHYPNRKDKRKQHRGSKSFDRSCRPGGSCPWCADGRKHADKRREPVVTFDDIKREYEDDLRKAGA